MEEQVHDKENQVVERNESPRKIYIASTSQRIANLVLDYFFCNVFASMFGIIVVSVGLAEVIVEMNEFFLRLLVVILYYVPQEALSGRTLGKLITKTKAVNTDGSKLTFGRAIGRTLCRFIPIEIFSFVGGGGRPIGWHDWIPGTIVISTRKV